MPAAAGATPAQTTPVSPAADPTAATTTPATGDADALGDAGKRALEAERKAAKEAQRRAEAAERELETLRTATQTEGEKAITTAKREAAAEEKAKFETKLRRAEVRSALRSAGLANDALLELAMKSDLFATLAVDDEGRVTDLDKAVAQLKKDAPEMFAPPTPGTVTRGVQTPAAPERAKDLESSVADYYRPKT